MHINNENQKRVVIRVSFWQNISITYKKPESVGTGSKWRHQSSRFGIRPGLSTKQTYNYVYEPLFIHSHYHYTYTLFSIDETLRISFSFSLSFL